MVTVWQMIAVSMVITYVMSSLDTFDQTHPNPVPKSRSREAVARFVGYLGEEVVTDGKRVHVEGAKFMLLDKEVPPSQVIRLLDDIEVRAMGSSDHQYQDFNDDKAFKHAIDRLVDKEDYRRDIPDHFYIYGYEHAKKIKKAELEASKKGIKIVVKDSSKLPRLEYNVAEEDLVDVPAPHDNHAAVDHAAVANPPSAGTVIPRPVIKKSFTPIQPKVEMGHALDKLQRSSAALDEALRQMEVKLAESNAAAGSEATPTGEGKQAIGNPAPVGGASWVQPSLGSVSAPAHSSGDLSEESGRKGSGEPRLGSEEGFQGNESSDELVDQKLGPDWDEFTELLKRPAGDVPPPPASGGDLPPPPDNVIPAGQKAPLAGQQSPPSAPAASNQDLPATTVGHQNLSFPLPVQGNQGQGQQQQQPPPAGSFPPPAGGALPASETSKGGDTAGPYEIIVVESKATPSDDEWAGTAAVPFRRAPGSRSASSVLRLRSRTATRTVTGSVGGGDVDTVIEFTEDEATAAVVVPAAASEPVAVKGDGSGASAFATVSLGFLALGLLVAF